MEFKRVTVDTIDHEHICCSISDAAKDFGVANKKQWLKERMQEGLVFDKLDVRGKVFIEYLPAEVAWDPIEAPDYMYINCLWVSGQYHGQGYAKQLLDRCVQDSKAKGKKGLVIVSSKKKQPYLSEPGFLKHYGFEVVDEASPYFELLRYSFEPDTSTPKFKACAKSGTIEATNWTIYYTHQCPHTTKYVPLLVETMAEKGIEINSVLIDTLEKAQAAPAPHCTYAVFYQGKFVTNEILNEKSFQKRLDKLG